MTPAQNLPMIAGVGPLRAYRTLDLPALPTLTNLASAQPGGPERLAALRVTGTGVCVLDGLAPPASDRAAPALNDPALASWLFGARLVASQGNRLSRFVIDRPLSNPARAWRLRLTAKRGTRMLETSEKDVGAILRLYEQATPLPVRSPFPGRVEIELNADGGDVVVISQLADPQWRAEWVGGRGRQAAAVLPAFRGRGQAGWQAVTVPEPGTWTLRLEYDARDVRQGLAVSGVAWFALCGVVMLAGRRGPGPVTEGQET